MTLKNGYILYTYIVPDLLFVATAMLIVDQS